MPAVTVSTNLESEVAERVKSIASAEHRSVSNLVAAAILLLTELPKDVRDEVLEVRAAQDRSQMRKLTREFEAAVARHRFDRASAALASERRLDPALAGLSEIEVLEGASSGLSGPTP